MSESHIPTAAAASQLAPDNGEIEIDLTPSTGKVPEVPDGVYPLTLKEIARAPSQFGGQVPVLKFTMKHEELVGRKCQGVVQNVPGKKDPTKKFPRITTLLPTAA